MRNKIKMLLGLLFIFSMTLNVYAGGKLNITYRPSEKDETSMSKLLKQAETFMKNNPNKIDTLSTKITNILGKYNNSQKIYYYLATLSNYIEIYKSNSKEDVELAELVKQANEFGNNKNNNSTNTNSSYDNKLKAIATKFIEIKNGGIINDFSYKYSENGINYSIIFDGGITEIKDNKVTDILLKNGELKGKIILKLPDNSYIVNNKKYAITLDSNITNNGTKVVKGDSIDSTLTKHTIEDIKGKVLKYAELTVDNIVIDNGIEYIIRPNSPTQDINSSNLDYYFNQQDINTKTLFKTSNGRYVLIKSDGYTKTLNGVDTSKYTLLNKGAIISLYVDKNYNDNLLKNEYYQSFMKDFSGNEKMIIDYLKNETGIQGINNMKMDVLLENNIGGPSGVTTKIGNRKEIKIVIDDFNGGLLAHEMFHGVADGYNLGMFNELIGYYTMYKIRTNDSKVKSLLSKTGNIQELKNYDSYNICTYKVKITDRISISLLYYLTNKYGDGFISKLIVNSKGYIGTDEGLVGKTILNFENKTYSEVLNQYNKEYFANADKKILLMDGQLIDGFNINISELKNKAKIVQIIDNINGTIYENEDGKVVNDGVYIDWSSKKYYGGTSYNFHSAQMDISVYKKYFVQNKDLLTTTLLGTNTYYSQLLSGSMLSISISIDKEDSNNVNVDFLYDKNWMRNK